MSATESPNKKPPLSPTPKSPLKMPFLIPSPIVTRRTRTSSLSRFASDGPQKTGTIAEFCRKRGHGFVTPDDDSSERLFVHVSDVEGEFIPQAGDHVTYKECPIPPKRTKVQAVEVTIIDLAPGTKHLRWEDPDGWSLAHGPTFFGPFHFCGMHK